MRTLNTGRAASDFVFFFQAEDGIRDGTVTGVQTCALPISDGNLRLRGLVSSRPRRDAGRPLRLPSRADVRLRRDDAWLFPSWLAFGSMDERSEERRVGKECRSRGSACDSKRKEEVKVDARR